MIDRKDATARAVQYELEFQVRASVKRVWRGLTRSINKWWLPDFRMLGPDSRIELDASAGGGMVEATSNASLLWYTVIEAKSEQSLTLAGYCTSRFGGPCTTLLTWELAPDGDTTRIKLTDALYGLVNDATIESLSRGWTQLFQNGLRPWAEGAAEKKQTAHPKKKTRK